MIKINFDGACGPRNPGGRCGGGAVILKDGELLKELYEEYFPPVKYETSNNVGEYKGLLIALEYLIDNKIQDESILVEGDSKMVIMQMSNKWKIKKGIYRDIAIETKNILKRFNKIKFNWIPREENQWADELSKKSINI